MLLQTSAYRAQTHLGSFHRKTDMILDALFISHLTLRSPFLSEREWFDHRYFYLNQRLNKKYFYKVVFKI